jgi:predicted RND superfamily exporter protein
VEPPAGYQYHAAGLTYVGVTGLQAIRGGQVVLNALAALLVLLVLLASYRGRRPALMAWLPTLLVAGWSSAILTVLRVPLTPMTAVLGAVVVAFGTEFAVLWLERYRESIEAGLTPGDAVPAASLAAAPGIVVSGSALALGFLALAAGGLPGVSNLGFDLPMVRDFGLVAAMDIVLAVAAALVVLPALVLRLEAAREP